MSFIEESYRKQSDHFKITDDEIELRFQTNSIDRWRHARMYDCIKPLIHPSDSWLTVGDGRYGSDSFFLKERGVKNILPTDLSDKLLKIGLEKGIVADYRVENAENLSFGDASYDWVFCKEAYHHFPRPMIATYEMLRVAKEGIVLIEPNDGLIETRHLATPKVGWEIFKRSLINSVKSKMNRALYYPFGSYEEAGNYVFTISRRELEKVALGIDLPWIAFKGVNDHYEPGYELELASADNPVFSALQKRISKADRRVRNGKGPFGLLVAVIGKRPLLNPMKEELIKAGYDVIKLPRNPF